jgi:hypothetical protein
MSQFFRRDFNVTTSILITSVLTKSAPSILSEYLGYISFNNSSQYSVSRADPNAICINLAYSFPLYFPNPSAIFAPTEKLERRSWSVMIQLIFSFGSFRVNCTTRRLAFLAFFQNFSSLYDLILRLFTLILVTLSYSTIPNLHEFSAWLLLQFL